MEVEIIKKDIIGYEGLYSIDSKGQIYSSGEGKGRGREKLLKPFNVHGEKRVDLCKEGLCQRYSVAMLKIYTFDYMKVCPNVSNRRVLIRSMKKMEGKSIQEIARILDMTPMKVLRELTK